jgi:hypothetical protein
VLSADQHVLRKGESLHGAPALTETERSQRQPHSERTDKKMRHSRISTTMEIYAQIVPLAQRRAFEQLSEFAKDSRSITVQ